MKTIYKFQLEIIDEQIIEVPNNTKFLSAQYQNGVLCLWGIVATEMPKQKTVITIIGTGNQFDYDENKHDYIATVQQPPFVWHIFSHK